jgi:DNA polymerase-3 subunit epsilon
MSNEIILTIGDTETTGLEQKDGHRIIEVAFSIWAYDTVAETQRKLGNTWVQRINPMRTIDPGAEAVHKISLPMLRGCPTWDQVAPTVNKILSKTKIFIAHNAAFDAPFLALELARAGFPIPAFDVFCTMDNGRGSTGMGKAPNLGELCFACGVEYDPDAAHSAAYDTDVLAQCYWTGIEIGLFKKPTEL